MHSPGVAFDRLRTYTLKRKIAAIRIADDGERLGLFTELPESVKVEVCGAGFNEATVKVCWAGQIYFVFRRDLDRHPNES